MCRARGGSPRRLRNLRAKRRTPYSIGDPHLSARGCSRARRRDDRMGHAVDFALSPRRSRARGPGDRHRRVRRLDRHQRRPCRRAGCSGRQPEHDHPTARAPRAARGRGLAAHHRGDARFERGLPRLPAAVCRGTPGGDPAHEAAIPRVRVPCVGEHRGHPAVRRNGRQRVPRGSMPNARAGTSGSGTSSSPISTSAPVNETVRFFRFPEEFFFIRTRTRSPSISRPKPTSVRSVPTRLRSEPRWIAPSEWRRCRTFRRRA